MIVYEVDRMHVVMFRISMIGLPSCMMHCTIPIGGMYFMDCDPLGKHSFSSTDDAPHQICGHPCSHYVNMDNDPLGKHSFSFIKDAPHQNCRNPLLHALMDDVPCQINC